MSLVEERLDEAFDGAGKQVDFLLDQERALKADSRILVTRILDIKRVQLKAHGDAIGDVRIEVSVQVDEKRRRLLEFGLVCFDALDIQGELSVKHPVVVRAVTLIAGEMLFNLWQLGWVDKDLAWLILAELRDDILTDE